MAITKVSRARLPFIARSLRPPTPPTPHELATAQITSEGQRERRLREAEWRHTRTPWLSDDGEDATLTS